MIEEEVFGAKRQWITAMAVLPPERVMEMAGRLAKRHSVNLLAVPQAGIALLPLRESVERQVFYLGDVPLSTCRVEIRSPEGHTVEGAALLMADDAERAEAMAICEGVLAHRLDGWQETAGLVAEGLEHLRHEARIRKTMLTRSWVDFALLNEEADEEEGNEGQSIDGAGELE